MATFRTRASGTVEACIRRKQLPGALYLTFPNMEAARSYCKEAEALIDAGTVPKELLEFAKPKEGRRDKPESMYVSVADAIRDYLTGYHVKTGDIERLNTLLPEIGHIAVGEVTVQWAIGLVRSYKLEKNYTPATIRHRIGALRRCLDWHVTMGNLPMNPLKLLPVRYATYNEAERNSVDEAPPEDNSRSRRLEPGEEDRIRKVLTGDKDYIKSIGAERGLRPESLKPMLLLFELAVETAMRMSEMFTLTWDQVDIGRRTIFLDRTKNGDSRQVPMSSVAVELFKQGGEGRVFPTLWDGDTSERGIKAGSNRVSKRWRTIARLAKCDDLHFHDLRHEATSRLFERTNFTDVQISLITGHRDPRMLRRYANLRASTLADAMW